MIEVRYASSDDGLFFDELLAKNADVHVEVLEDHDPAVPSSQACVTVTVNAKSGRKTLFIYADGAMHFDVEEG